MTLNGLYEYEKFIKTKYMFGGREGEKCVRWVASFLNETKVKIIARFIC